MEELFFLLHRLISVHADEVKLNKAESRAMI